MDLVGRDTQGIKELLEGKKKIICSEQYELMYAPVVNKVEKEEKKLEKKA